MDINNQRVIVETRHEVEDVLGVCRTGYIQERYINGCRRKPSIEQDQSNLDMISSGDLNTIPYEMGISASKLVIRGLREVANTPAKSADESVKRRRFRRYLVDMKLPLVPMSSQFTEK